MLLQTLSSQEIISRASFQGGRWAWGRSTVPGRVCDGGGPGADLQEDISPSDVRWDLSQMTQEPSPLALEPQSVSFLSFFPVTGKQSTGQVPCLFLSPNVEMAD